MKSCHHCKNYKICWMTKKILKIWQTPEWKEFFDFNYYDIAKLCKRFEKEV